MTSGSLAFGTAARLYHRQLHPRLLLGPADLTRLRVKTRAGPGRKLLDALRQKTRPWIERLLTGNSWREKMAQNLFFWPKPEAVFAWLLPDIALIGVLDADSRAIEAVRRVFRTLTATELLGASGGFVSRQYYIPPLFLPYAYDLIADELSAVDRRNYVEWAVRNHIRLVIEHRQSFYLKNAAHNMTLGGMELALLTLLAVKGEAGAPDLKPEMDLLVRWLEATLHTAIGTDGYPEEDIGYGTVVAPMLAQVVEALHRAGIYDAYSDCPRFARFGQAMLHFIQPWGGFLSNTGDQGDQLRDREFVLARLATRTKDPTLLWLLGALTYAYSRTFIADKAPDLEREIDLRPGFSVPVTWLSLVALDDLKKTVHPSKQNAPTQFCDHGRGLVTFRSGWNADDTFVVFDGSQRSPSAPGHYHDSCGHFSISALGEYFAIDTGRYNIEQNCHNVVLIDGKSGRSTNSDWQSSCYHGLLTDYLPGEFVDFASVDSSHQHNGYWARRHLGLVKGEIPPAFAARQSAASARRRLGRGIKNDKGRSASAYVWTVEDINKANDWAEFWWQLHTSPENSMVVADNHATICGWRQGNLMDVHLVLPAASEYPKPHTVTWAQDESTPSSSKYVGDPRKQIERFARPSDMLHGPVFARPRLIAKVGGYNGRFMSLMIPRFKGQSPAKVERLTSIANSLAVKITFAEVEDTVIFAYEHNLLEAGNVCGRGQWCVVRQSRAGGRVVDWSLGHGTSLRADGQPLKISQVEADV